VEAGGTSEAGVPLTPSSRESTGLIQGCFR
jgi:hypothetical protein